MQKHTKNLIIGIFVGVIIIGMIWQLVERRNSDKELFANNLKCAQYIEQQNKEINEIANLPINEGKIVAAPKIFFSTELNTCVSAFSINDFHEKGFSSFYINNLLNNDSIFSEGGRTDETVNGVSLAKIAEQKYREKLKELGGE